MIHGMKRGTAGFTLVELIVVIAILGILAGIATPVYSGYIAKAQEASDLQLLGAVNTAWAAACAEVNQNPTKLSGNVSLTGADGAKKVGTVSASLDNSAIEGFGEAFARYYAGNEDETFKKFVFLRYVQPDGVFKGYAADDEISIYTETYGTVSISAEDLASFKASTYSDVGIDYLMNNVDKVVTAASSTMTKLMAVIGDDSLETFVTDTLGIGMDGFNALSDTQKANALVLMVAAQTKDMNASDIIAAYNETGKIGDDFNIVKLKEGGVSEQTANLTLPYALSMAYVNSDMAGIIETGISNTYKYDSQEEAIAKAESLGLTSDNVTYSNKGKCWIFNTGNMDAKDFFYNGASSRLENIVGADNMSTAAHALTLTDKITSSDGFKAYLTSEQGAADLEGFLSAMNMLDSNVNKDNAAAVLRNGFADNEWISMLGSVLGS